MMCCVSSAFEWKTSGVRQRQGTAEESEGENGLKKLCKTVRLVSSLRSTLLNEPIQVPRH